MMTTKFDIGQKVYAVSKEFLTKDTITWIGIDSDEIKYTLAEDDGWHEFSEAELFTDKLDAVHYWMQVNNVDLSVELKITDTNTYKNL